MLADPIRSVEGMMSGPRFALLMFAVFTLIFFGLGALSIIPDFGGYTPIFLFFLGFFSFFFPYRLFLDWITHMFIFLGPVFVLSVLWKYSFFLAYLWFGAGFFLGLWMYQKKFI